MEKTQFYCQFVNPPHAKKEKPSGKSKVDKSGYVPIQDKIVSMLAAGKRLYDSRTALYDIPAGSKIDPESVQIDPTRSKGLDLAEASRIQAEVNARLKATADARKKVAAEAKKAPAGVKEEQKDPEKGSKGHTDTLDNSMAQ